MKRAARNESLAAVVILFLAAALSGCGGSGSEEPATEETSAELSLPEGDSKERSDPVEITLFFPGASGLLYPEPRAVLLPEAIEQQAATILRELLDGPRSEALARPFDETVRLGGVYVSGLGSGDVVVSVSAGTSSGSVAIVDLVSTDALNPPASGSREERQRVYGVVHSLLENVPSLNGVVLLWNGRQRSTFAGHVDTGHVLRRDAGLIAVVP